MIPAQAPETKQSRLLFKKEWVSILADAGERVGENEETFHEVEGELIEFRETSERAASLRQFQCIEFKC